MSNEVSAAFNAVSEHVEQVLVRDGVKAVWWTPFISLDALRAGYRTDSDEELRTALKNAMLCSGSQNAEVATRYKVAVQLIKDEMARRDGTL